MKRVFVYCRVSTANQTDGDGFDRQEAACREFADRKGWKVVRVFREQQSGSDEWADRKQLSEAVKLATKPEDASGAATNTRNLGVDVPSDIVDTIIVERADRLARDLIVSEVFLRDCKARGVLVYTADTGDEIVNSDGNPARTMIRQVLGAVAQFDKSCIVQKMQAGRRATALKTGKPCGGVKANPYGDRGGVAQRNMERAVIQNIFTLRGQGVSYSHIARRLTLARVKNPNGPHGPNTSFMWTGKVVWSVVKYWETREL